MQHYIKNCKLKISCSKATGKLFKPDIPLLHSSPSVVHFTFHPLIYLSWPHNLLSFLKPHWGINGMNGRSEILWKLSPRKSLVTFAPFLSHLKHGERTRKHAKLARRKLFCENRSPPKRKSFFRRLSPQGVPLELEFFSTSNCSTYGNIDGTFRGLFHLLMKSLQNSWKVRGTSGDESKGHGYILPKQHVGS